jgi:hypothetical protein
MVLTISDYRNADNDETQNHFFHEPAKGGNEKE